MTEFCGGCGETLTPDHLCNDIHNVHAEVIGLRKELEEAKAAWAEQLSNYEMEQDVTYSLAEENKRLREALETIHKMLVASLSPRMAASAHDVAVEALHKTDIRCKEDENV